DRNRSHWSTSKTPSYTKSVSWQHHHERDDFQYQYVDIRAEGITKEDLQQKAGKPVETVPQIFVDQQHIGGYTDFAAWVKENLDA
ncbi:GrxA family glutaredoxin, partial [Escherichia coli]